MTMKTCSRLRAPLALFAAFALGLTTAFAEVDTATNRPPVQTFYLPIPEEDLLQTLTSIHGGASWTLPAEPVASYNSIVVFVDGTVIYYDQWEDGYEQDIANPNHLYGAANPAGTQIWGDGDPSNGYPPNYPNDKLYAGDVIILSSEVKVNGRNPAKLVYFDGSDKIGVSRPVAIARAVWASQSQTLFAGANEVYDTSFFGTEFVVPVGEDTADQNEIFQYTGASIMAGAGGATVSVDLDANGTYDRTATLAEGQTLLVDGDLRQGAKIRATRGSVQVNLLTGDVYDGYESRFITLLPTSLWSSAYTSPVATPTTTKANRTTYQSGTKIWLYNPSSSAIRVYYETATASAKYITVPAKSSAYVVAGAKTTTSSDTFTGSTTSGVYVYTRDGSPFYAIATVDSTGTGTSTYRSQGGDNRTWDWGFALIPDSSMSSQIVVGLGLGRDPTSNTSPNENGAPIWTVADRDTVLYVDYDGNPDTGAYIDANGSKYDKAYNVDRLEIAKVYNPSGDQTGMLIYTLNGAKIAAAWGEDPATASPGQPGLDLGTGIPPMPEWVMRKSSKLVVDADDDGFMTPGDTIEYTVEFLNVGRQPVSGLSLKDELPADVTYVANSSAFSSTYRGYPGEKHAIADKASGDIFPFSGDGLDLTIEANSENGGNLRVGGAWYYTYRARINDTVNSDTIHNIAIAVGPDGMVTNAITDPLRASIGDTVWLDADGDGIQDAGESPIAGIVVRLVDADGNLVYNDKDLPYEVTTDANGNYLFKGVRPGTYQVLFDLPPYYAATVQDAGSNDATDSDIDDTGATASFTLRGGQVRLDVDAGLVLVDDPASIKIVKLAGDAPDGTVLALDAKGETVTYTYKVTNTGKTYLSGVTVTDDKLDEIGTVEGLLAPGATVIFTKDAPITRNVVNTGTVVGTPCAKDGTEIPFLDDVTDDDKAEVTVPADPATIGDRVWADIDGDGIQDEGEPGLPGVTVTLKDGDGNVVASQKTDANGNYLFEDVPAGSYTVVFTSPDNVYEFTTSDAGNDDADSDADPSGNASVTVGEGDVNLTIDAGLKLKNGAAAINLVKLAGDAADGTALQLARYGDTATYTYKVTNTGLATLVNVIVTDDKLGTIGTIASLAPGASATLTASAQLTEDTTNIGTVTATPTTKSGDPIPGVPSVTDEDNAVVLVPEQTATIGDRVWIDANGNGVQDADEAGLSGVEVTLKDANGNPVATKTTDGNGNYLFTDVVPGTYTVVFTAPANWTFTAKDAGSNDAADSDADSAGTVSVTVAPGADDRTIDAGLVLADGVASIQIVKTAGNAPDGTTLRTAAIGADVTYTYKVTNTGRTYLKDVEVTDDKLGTIGTVAGILAPGASAELTKTAPISTDTKNIATVTGTPCDENGTTVDTDKVSDTDDALVDVPDEPASIGDRAWIDLDGDGEQDAGEPGLPGVVVTLKDATGAVVATTTTDANGNYLFTDVNPGDYTVTFAPAESWWTPTAKDATADTADSDINAAGVTETFILVSLVDDLTRDAGYVFKTSAASIAIVKTAGESAIGKGESVTYTYVVSNTGSTYLKDVAVTDDKLGAIGTVALLAPGASQTLTATAILTEDTTNVGTATGTPADATGTPIPGAPDVTDDDDATVSVNTDPAIVGDRVWNDVDGDGIQDAGELGIQGVTVNLLDAEGNVVATTTTDANGNYRFEISDPGTYAVAFVPSAAWTFTAKDAGDDAADSDADPATGRTPFFTVSAGQTDLTLDAGLVGGVPPGFCELIDVANKFNAFIGGDFTADGGDTEGNLLVGGNATLGAGYSVGLIGPGYGRTREAAAIGTDSFVVAGDLTETTAPDMNGNIVYGGAYTYLGETGNRILAFYDIRNVSPVTLDENWNVPEDGSGRTLADIAADLDLFSAIVAALPESEGVEKDYETDPWNIVWKGTNTFRNVFWVDAADFSLENKGIWLDVPAGSKVVVNVFGDTVTETYSDIYLPEGVDPTLVLFNFVDATSITTTGYEFHGSVLAPFADATFSGASIDGFAYIGGDVRSSNGFEFHDFDFKAFDCSRSIVTVNKPGLGVYLSANGYDVGQIVRVAEGGSLDIVQKVANTGRTSLENVVLVDALGNRYALGALAAGESKSVTVSAPAAAGLLSATATADVVAADGSAVEAYEGASVSATGSLTVQVLTAEDFAAYEAAEAVAEAAKLGYIPRPDFEVTSINFVNGSPTITGEVFSVVAKIKNVGETTAYPGKVALYVSHAAIVALGEAPDATEATTQSLEPGQEMEITFKNVKAPGQGGPHHVRVLVDADNAVDELSEGNNQLPLFYFLNNIAVSISIQGSKLTLTWNSYEGQAYTVRAATTLDAFEDYIPVGSDGLDNLGYFHMPATPPYNTAEIELNGAGARFFKIRVDNLTDEAR